MVKCRFFFYENEQNVPFVAPESFADSFQNCWVLKYDDKFCSFLIVFSTYGQDN
jgi:hypothetical protein